jgi:hypothetical protein
MLGKHAAAIAVSNATYRVGECRREIARTIAIAFQQMESDALRRFLANAWHTAQAIDQSNQ